MQPLELQKLCNRRTREYSPKAFTHLFTQKRATFVFENPKACKILKENRKGKKKINVAVPLIES